jgi:hypothetical protein
VSRQGLKGAPLPSISVKLLHYLTDLYSLEKFSIKLPMKIQENDKWLFVGVSTILATLLFTIGIPSLPAPVKVPAHQAKCLLVFDSPPLSSRFDVTINGISKGKALVEKVLEDVSWATAQTMLLEFAAFQKIARHGFHPITTQPSALQGKPMEHGYMYFTSESDATVVRVKGTKAEQLNSGGSWDDVSSAYEVPAGLEDLRPLLTKGLWHRFTNTPEHIEASVALSPKRIVRISILARNDVSLTCSAMAQKHH